jgi:hypothetical protein
MRVSRRYRVTCGSLGARRFCATRVHEFARTISRWPLVVGRIAWRVRVLDGGSRRPRPPEPHPTRGVHELRQNVGLQRETERRSRCPNGRMSGSAGRNGNANGNAKRQLPGETGSATETLSARTLPRSVGATRGQATGTRNLALPHRKQSRG